MPPFKVSTWTEKEMTYTENSPPTNKYQETLTSYTSETCLTHVAPHVSNIMHCAVEFSGEGAMEQHIFTLPLETVSRTD